MAISEGGRAKKNWIKSLVNFLTLLFAREITNSFLLWLPGVNFYELVVQINIGQL